MQLDADAIETIMLHDEEEDEHLPTHTVLAVTKLGPCTALLLNVSFFVCALLSFSGGYFRCDPIIEHYRQETQKTPFSISFTLENITRWHKMVVLSSTVNSTSATSLSVTANIDMHRVSYSGKNSLESRSDIMLSYTVPESGNVSNSCHVFTDANVGYASVNYIVTYMSATGAVTGADLTVLYLDPRLMNVLAWVSFSALCVVLAVYLAYFVSGSRSEGELPVECGLMRAAVLLFVLGCGIGEFLESSDWLFPLLTVSRVCAASLVWLQRLILFSLAKSKDPTWRKMFPPLQIIMWSTAWVFEIICCLRDSDRFITAPYEPDDSTTHLFRVLTILTCILWAVATIWSSQLGVFLGTFCLQVFVFSLTGPLLTLLSGTGMTRTFFRTHSVIFPGAMNVFLLALTWPVSPPSAVYN